MNAPRGFIRRLRSAAVPSSISSWAARRSKFAVQFDERSSWSEAVEQSSGYSDHEIISRVESATQSVLAGEGAFERDGVLFHQQEYRLPIADALNAIRERDSFLRVVDFGGALGSVYWQHRQLLAPLDTTWAVVEQPHFVDRGNALPTAEVTFFTDLHAALETVEPNVVLFSSVLQYLPDPMATLRDLLRISAADLILDRTPMHAGSRNIPTIQKVPEHIYPGSYPAWIISQSQLTDLLSPLGSLTWFPGIEPAGQTRQGTHFQWQGAIAHRSEL